MEQSTQPRKTGHRLPIRQLATTALAVGGLSASVFTATSAGASTHQTTKSVVVTTAKYSKFGTILQSGKTLYTLTPSKVACTAACLKIWPEFVLPAGVLKATAGPGVSSSKLGTIMRANGVRQVTYNGKALYWFAADKSTGTTGRVNGNLTDTWGKWSDVATVKPASSSTGSGTGNSGGSSTGGTTAGSGGAAF